MMNNGYMSSSLNNYSQSYDYSFGYSSPSISTYFYSPLLPSPCPVHSSYNFYTTTTSPSSSMNVSNLSYNYYQQQQPMMYSPPVQQQISVVDRTPLRRHKCFKKNELEILHQAYIRDSRPSTDVLQQLAIQVKAPIEKVRQWFKNRRHSDKQKKREVFMARTSTTT